MHLENLTLKEAEAAMTKALTPRTEDGKIYPMSFTDEVAPAKHFPHFRQKPMGVRCMVFADEFEHGQIPEDLEYVPGHEKPGAAFDGSNFDAIVYEDPRLNLPYCDWLRLQASHTPSTLPKMEPIAPWQQRTISPANQDDEDVRVFSTPKGLLLQTKSDFVKLTNFGLIVTEKQTLYHDGKDIGSEVMLTIERAACHYPLQLDAANIDSAVKSIQQKYPECRLLYGGTSGAQHVADFIREQLAHCKQTHVYKTPGFTAINGEWLYVHDAARFANQEICFACGKQIGCLQSLTAQQAFQHAFNVLGLSSRLELMLPLLLLMHLGPLFNLFRAAGCSPRFVTFLAGTTGSLKTSLSLALFNLFEQLVEKPAANFFDTENALEQKLGKTFSQVLLVDDFCPAVTSSNGRQKLARLETVIRFVGDQISKSRSTPNQKLAKEFYPVGCCLVTGENTGGSQSSLLRCLVLPINKGDINGKLLSVFQRNPLLLQTHMFHFLDWAGRRGNEILSFLQANFLEERQAFTSCAQERRIVDSGATLMLTARLLLQYGVEIGSISNERAAELSTVWRKSIETALQTSEASTRDLDPLSMYLDALFELRNSGRLALASSQSSYIPSEHIGFVDGDRWWLRPDDVFVCVTRWWKGLGQIFPLKDGDIRKLLAQNNLIDVEHGTRKDGTERVTYTRKTTLEGRPRMIVLRAEDARDFLEHQMLDS